jgi:hypothetical protein
MTEPYRLPDQSTEYLNTDLVLEGYDLTPLIAALRSEAHTILTASEPGPIEGGVPWSPRERIVRAVLELNEAGPDASAKSPEGAIMSFCALLRRHTHAARRARVSSIVFDVGIQPGRTPWTFPVTFGPTVLLEVVGVAARLQVTVYGEPDPNPPDPPVAAATADNETKDERQREEATRDARTGTDDP